MEESTAPAHQHHRVIKFVPRCCSQQQPFSSPSVSILRAASLTTPRETIVCIFHIFEVIEIFTEYKVENIIA